MAELERFELQTWTWNGHSEMEKCPFGRYVLHSSALELLGEERARTKVKHDLLEAALESFNAERELLGRVEAERDELVGAVRKIHRLAVIGAVAPARISMITRRALKRYEGEEGQP